MSWMPDQMSPEERDRQAKLMQEAALRQGNNWHVTIGQAQILPKGHNPYDPGPKGVPDAEMPPAPPIAARTGRAVESLAGLKPGYHDTRGEELPPSAPGWVSQTPREDFMRSQAPGYRGPVPQAPPGGWGDLKPADQNPASKPAVDPPRPVRAAAALAQPQQEMRANDANNKRADSVSDSGPKSAIWDFLSTLPLAAANLKNAADMKGHYTPQANGTLLDAINGRVGRSNEIMDRGEQGRRTFARQQAFDARQADKDALERGQLDLQNRRATDAEKRQAMLDKAAAEAANPDSAENIRKRELADAAEAKKAGLLHQGRMEEIAAQGANAEKLAGANNQARLDRQKLRSAGRGGAGAGADLSGDRQAKLDALAEQFGGADKIPPMVKNQFDRAFAIRDPKMRETALRSADTAAKGFFDRRTADLEKERPLYEKGSSAWRQSQQALSEIDKTLQSYGTGLDAKKGEDLSKVDLPGYGRLESHIPNALASDKAQTLRRQVQNYVSLLANARSGKQVSDRERELINQLSGGGSGMTDSQLVSALRELRGMASDTQQSLDASYPTAASDYASRRGPTPSQPTLGSPPPLAKHGGAVAPKSGFANIMMTDGKETLPFTEEEAALMEKEGWKRAQ